MQMRRSQAEILKAKKMLGLASDSEPDLASDLATNGQKFSPPKSAAKKKTPYRRRQDAMSYDEWALVVSIKLEATTGLDVEDITPKLLNHLFLHTNTIDEAVCTLTEVLRPAHNSQTGDSQ